MWDEILIRFFSFCYEVSHPFVPLLIMMQKYGRPEFEAMERWIAAKKHVLQDTMTYLFQSKGLEMSPNISAEDTLVVRKLPCPDAG